MNRKKTEKFVCLLLRIQNEGTEFDIRSSLMTLDVRAMSFIQTFRPSNVLFHEKNVGESILCDYLMTFIGIASFFMLRRHQRKLNCVNFMIF